MQNTQIAFKIKELCKSNSISVSLLLQECSISKSFIYDLEKRSTSPSCDKVCRIADYLDCSVDYLLGRTDVPEINKKESNVINITPKEEFTGELAAFGGDFKSNNKPKKPEIL